MTHNKQPRRWARSYSIVDHQLIHAGFFHKLTPYALGLYLFLVTVGDRCGKSCYSEIMIRNILRFSKTTYDGALDELLRSRLIEFRPPYFWVLNLPLPDSKQINSFLS